MIEKPTARLLSPNLLPSCTTILLKTSERDDALCYQAAISVAGVSTAMVHLHESSLLLERVRLMGALLVIVEAAGEKFWGELRTHRDTPSLLLEIFDRSELPPTDHYLFPNT